MDFLTASYDHLAASRETVKLRKAGESRRAEDDWRLAAEEANDVMMKAVTRIRVLASDRMAELALVLHDRTEVEVALFKDRRYQDFVDGRRERIAAFHVDRDVFIDEAKRLLGIPEDPDAGLRLRRQ